MSKSVKRVRAALEAAGVEAAIHEMSGETRTAQQAADVVGCAVDQIAKSIVFFGPKSERIFLFVTAGSKRVDIEKAQEAAGEPLVTADAARVREETGFVIGGVAPIGHLKRLVSFFDPRLEDFEAVWAAAGTPRHVFSISPAALRKLCGAQAIDFTA